MSTREQQIKRKKWSFLVTTIGREKPKSDQKQLADIWRFSREMGELAIFEVDFYVKTIACPNLSLKITEWRHKPLCPVHVRYGQTVYHGIINDSLSNKLLLLRHKPVIKLKKG